MKLESKRETNELKTGGMRERKEAIAEKVHKSKVSMTTGRDQNSSVRTRVSNAEPSMVVCRGYRGAPCPSRDTLAERPPCCRRKQAEKRQRHASLVMAVTSREHTHSNDPAVTCRPRNLPPRQPRSSVAITNERCNSGTMTASSGHNDHSHPVCVSRYF